MSKEKKTRYCIGDSCASPATVKGYCRFHYLVYWRDIRLIGQEKAEKKLDDFVNRLAEKYPKDYLKKIKEGIEDENKFTKVVGELDLETTKDDPETEREFVENFGRKVKPE